MATPPIHPKPSSRTFTSIILSTVATGISEGVNLTGLTLSAVQMSTDWTDAGIGFQASINNGDNYYNVYDTAGNFLVYQTSASRIVAFDPAIFSGLQWIKVVSETTAGVGVAQAASRVLRLALSEVVMAE